MGLLSYAHKTYYRFTLMTGAYMLNTYEATMLHGMLIAITIFVVRYMISILA